MVLHCYTEHIYRRFPIDIVVFRRNPLSLPPQRPTSLPACYPMRPHDALLPVTSTPRWRRSRYWCARRRPTCPVRYALARRGVSTVVPHGPWPICRGQRTAYAYSCASVSGSVAIVTVAAASSPSACPPWPPPGPGAPCGLPNTWWTWASPWGARPFLG